MYTQLTEGFEILSLESLNERALLQNRHDIKYVFPISMLNNILSALKQDYAVLSINNNCVFEYETMYYDTPELYFYQQHHLGRTNRIKVRKRTYVDANTHYLEVKIKNNKGLTEKFREPIAIEESKAPPAAYNRFFSRFIPDTLTNLQEILTVHYNRITLLHKTNIEKVTLDIAPCFMHDNQKAVYQQLVIAEVKVETKENASFCALMKAHHIKARSLSKYCLGVISLNKTIKYNNFKKQFTHIIKTNNQNELVTDIE